MNGVGWRTAMEAALYGPSGFFVRGGDDGPAGHFRTSVHASPLFARAVARLVHRVDSALGFPARFDAVDVGAGRGELLTALLAVLDGEACGQASETVAPGGYVPTHPVPGVGEAVARTKTDKSAGAKPLAERIRPVGVERAPRPSRLDDRIAWRRDAPDAIAGVLLATEWLDNVPLDLAEVDEHGRLRRVLVDPRSGEERLGPDADAADRLWAARWWPAATPGERVEVGWTRDAAWGEAVGTVRAGAALAVDYGHRKAARPLGGTLAGYRGGRQVTPVPDGSCDVTAHVAMDAVAVAGGVPYTLVTQREALRALGVDGARPPLELARADPAAYLRGLAGAGAAAELTDPDGLGGHWWLLHTVGIGGRGTMLG